MSATSAALLGAFIGAVAALVTAVLTNLGALRNERIRQEAAKRADYVQALRTQVAVRSPNCLCSSTPSIG